jgi:thioredoxin-like negative regulator of GroEL
MRVKGLILASRSHEDFPEAETSFLLAIDWARRQSANLFELNAATDLADLLLKQGREAQACEHLTSALDRMPGGILFPPQRRALQILNRLPSSIKAVG